MSKTNRRAHDIYKDIEQIKAALRVASDDVKLKASDMLSDSFENVGDKADAFRESVCDFVEDKPLKSIGIAALVGLVVGIYLSKQ